MKNKIVNNIYMYFIGALVLIGFFAALIYMALNNQDGKYTTIITDMTATIKYSFILIVGYYWGSSKSSSDKTDMIYNSTPTNTTDKPTP